MYDCMYVDFIECLTHSRDNIRSLCGPQAFLNVPYIYKITLLIIYIEKLALHDMTEARLQCELMQTFTENRTETRTTNVS